MADREETPACHLGHHAAGRGRFFSVSENEGNLGDSYLRNCRRIDRQNCKIIGEKEDETTGKF